MSSLEGLPQPALARVLSYLGFTDLFNLGNTSTALHQQLKELTTGVLFVTRPDEMCVQSNRLILGLNLVLNTDEEMLKAMLRSFPQLETLARSHKYKAGRLKFSVTPMKAEKLDHNYEEGCFKGKMAKNMLSPWGHHLLGHHYLDMLLALHTRLFLPLSHLDLQVDLLCESCQQFFSRLDQAEFLASSLNLNLRFVSLCFPERSPSSRDYLEFFTTIRGVKNITQLKLTDFPPQCAGQMSDTLGKLHNFHFRD